MGCQTATDASSATPKGSQPGPATTAPSLPTRPSTRLKSGSILECNSCHSRYDLSTHLPKALPCGHTICNACVEQKLASGDARCPFNDKQPFSADPPTDYGVRKCVDDASAPTNPVPATVEKLPPSEDNNGAKHDEKQEPGTPPPPTLPKSVAKFLSADCASWPEEFKSKVDAMIVQPPPVIKPPVVPVVPLIRPLKMVKLPPCEKCGGQMSCSQEAHVCAKCGKSMHGILCGRCGLLLCYTCFPVPPLEEGYRCHICGKNMKFTQGSYSCFKCGNYRSGTKCAECGFHLCYVCYPPQFKDGALCPCGSTLTFILKNKTCSKCGQYRFGTKCTSCDFHLCYICYPPPALGDYHCPSCHGTLSFQSDSCTCSLCKSVRSCSKCSTCEFALCYPCYPVPFPKKADDGTKLKCPCGGQIEFTLRSNDCAKCSQQAFGTRCKSCEFYICTKCYKPMPISAGVCQCGGIMVDFKDSHVCAHCGNYVPGHKCENCDFHLCQKCLDVIPQ